MNARGSSGLVVAKATNLAVAFAVELVMLGALVVWALSLSVAVWLRIVVAIASVALVGVLWGRFAAPTAARRLQGRSLLAFKIVVFAVGAALIAGQHVWWALTYAVVVAVNLALAEHWQQ